MRCIGCSHGTDERTPFGYLLSNMRPISSHKIESVTISNAKENNNNTNNISPTTNIKMRFTFLALLFATASSFSPALTHPSGSRTTVSLMNSDHEGAGREKKIDESFPVYIKNLTVENYEDSLEKLETLFKSTSESVGETYDDFVTQLRAKAKAIGKELPAGFGTKHH